MITRLPRPTGPERHNIVIVDAPGLYHGWQRRCLVCRASVSADHVPESNDCFEIIAERHWKNRDEQ